MRVALLTLAVAGCRFGGADLCFADADCAPCNRCDEGSCALYDCAVLGRACGHELHGTAACGGCLGGYREEASACIAVRCTDLDCAALHRLCDEGNESWPAECGACEAGRHDDAGLCLLDTCAQLSCAAQQRDCIEGTPAVCGGCAAGFLEQGDQCRAATCADLGCAAQHRACIAGSTSRPASCGACLAGHRPEGAACVPEWIFVERLEPGVELVDTYGFKTAAAGGRMYLLLERSTSQLFLSYVPSPRDLRTESMTGAPEFYAGYGSGLIGLADAVYHFGNDTRRYVGGAWQQVPTPPDRLRGEPALAVLDGRIHLAGGRVLGPTATFQAYEPTGGWSAAGAFPDLPWGVSQAMAAVLDRRFYLVGGIADNGEEDKMAVYDAAAMTWTPLPDGGGTPDSIVAHRGRLLMTATGAPLVVYEPSGAWSYLGAPGQGTWRLVDLEGEIYAAAVDLRIAPETDGVLIYRLNGLP